MMLKRKGHIMPAPYVTIDEFADDFEGNWLKFGDFAWHDQPEDAEHWGHYTIEVRGSGLIDLSNRAVIEETIKPYLGVDAESERHRHFAHGWVDVLTVRVRDPITGRYTKAFKELWHIVDRLQDYPILDETHHGEMEYDATLVWIEENMPETKDSLPKDWKEQMFSELWDAGVMDSSDQGYWTDPKNLTEAAFALGFLSFDAAVEAGKIDNRFFRGVAEAAEGQITEIAASIDGWPEIVAERMYAMGLDLSTDQHGQVKRSEVKKALANLDKYESIMWLAKEVPGQARLFNPRR